jgi:hypothetical protein
VAVAKLVAAIWQKVEEPYYEPVDRNTEREE